MKTPPAAEKLNALLADRHPNILSMLSERGRRVSFPWAGILGQTAEAKNVKYNATIGIANEDDGSPMRLASLVEPIKLPMKEVLPYASSFGVEGLRQKWREMQFEKSPSLKGKTISKPVVTAALTHGLTVAAYLFLDPGEELLVQKPFWGNYSLLFDVSFGSPITSIPLFSGPGLDLQSLKQSLEARRGGKVVLLLNFPNNPTGYTPTEQEASEIITILSAEAAQGTRIVTILDDAYFGLVFEKGIYRESLFGPLADAHENLLVVKIDGATKEDYVWGLRVGFITFACKGADAEILAVLEDKAGGSIRGMTSNTSNLSQNLVLRSFSSPSYLQEKQEKFEILKGRYETIKRELAAHPEWNDVITPAPYNSGYFMCLVPANGIDPQVVRKVLIEKFDSGIIVDQGLLRIAFSAIAAEHIPTLLSNIVAACREVQAC